MGLLTHNTTTASDRNVSTWHRLDNAAFDTMDFVSIHPYKDTDGIEAGPALLRDFYKSPGSGGLFGRSRSVPTYAFIVRNDRNNAYEFDVGIETPDRSGADTTVNDLTGWFTSRYGDSTINPVQPDNNALVTIPDIRPGDYVAAGSVSLTRNCIHPLKHLSSKSDRLDDDPYNAIIPAMSGHESRTMLQAVFRPCSKSWYTQGRWRDARQVSSSREEEHVEGWIDPQVVTETVTDPGDPDIQLQSNEPCFNVDIQLLAVSESADEATHRISEMRDMFTDLSNAATDQELTTTIKSGNAITDHINHMLRRDIPNRSSISRYFYGPASVLTNHELATIVHLPARDCKFPVDKSDITYSEMSEGPGVPPTAEQPTTATD